MKSYKHKCLILFLMASISHLVFSQGSRESNSNTLHYSKLINQKYGEATKALIKLLDQNPDIKSMLIKSITKAKAINPDKATNPAQNLQEYLEFITYCETAMPWALQNKPEYPEIFKNIYQSLSCFNFLIDQPLEELEGKGYFNNSLQYAEPFASWVSHFNKTWGKFLDTEPSWNRDYYQLAYKDKAFGLDKGWYEDSSNWNTFNQFFARYLKSADQRPIAQWEDNSIIVSPADSEPQGIWSIDHESNLITKKNVMVKSAKLKSIKQLIGEDSKYRDSFANGTFTHSFLNVNDYHRYHFPLAGTIKEVRIIKGINPTGGSLGWDKENNRYVFDPSSIGWQMLETRGCIILDTETFGLVALLPIGMAAVGSVNFEKGVTAGIQVKKGDMMGHFAFGGSDFILLFQENVNFRLEVPKSSKKSYKHILMGERLGRLTLKK